jgi:hypothetical protein
MSGGPMLAPDAAIALGIASTAMPFARTPEGEAERWLRVLRLHGEVGIALQALGVSEQPLPERHEGSDHAATAMAGADKARADANADAIERDPVARVTEHATRVAAERNARALATTDVLIAVMEVYGEDFDRVLQVHGTDRAEVLERLSLSAPRPA